MSISAPTDTLNLINSRPRTVQIANLYSFALLNGSTLRFTDARRPVTLGGITWAATPRPVRGSTCVERGTSISTQKVTLQEANGATIAMAARGFFNRAIYTLQRTFALPGAAWTQPYTRFVGRINSIEAITRSSVAMTAKCMLDDLDNDFPRDILEPDCSAVLFDARCGLAATTYKVSSSAAAGSTKNTLLCGLAQSTGYFTQGVLTFTSGTMSGLSYLVKQFTAGSPSAVLLPAYPFLDTPSAGATFSVTPGCDHLLSTCQSKYGYNPGSGAAPYFRGMPFIPDPTVTF